MCANKYNAVEMQCAHQTIVTMHAAIVWMVSVAIRWLPVNDPNVQQIKIVHTIWLASVNVVKTHAIVHQVLNVVSIITLLHANVCRDTLVMHTPDAL